MKKDAAAAAPARMPGRYFALLCDLLNARGVDVDALLRAADIRPAQIYGTELGLTVEQLESFVAEATRRSGRDDLGFEGGRQIKLSTHEILGYGIVTSPTLDHAITLATRYYRLITPWFRMSYRRGAQQSEVEFQPAVPLSPQAMPFMLELVIVSAHEQFKALLQGRAPAYDIYVSYAEPSYKERYRELSPARFHFATEGLPGARMVFPSDLVSRTLPMADRAALKMAEARCEELLRKTEKAGGLTGWIAMMLRESHEGMPTLAELAHLLNQSVRTLDRRLEDEGTRFLELSKRIRHERACELLDAGTSVTQVAYQVGYRDVANFTRAFRRESGQTPSEYASRKPRGGERT